MLQDTVELLSLVHPFFILVQVSVLIVLEWIIQSLVAFSLLEGNKI